MGTPSSIHMLQEGVPYLLALEVYERTSYRVDRTGEDTRPVSQAQATQKTPCEGSQGGSPGSTGLVSPARS